MRSLVTALFLAILSVASPATILADTHPGAKADKVLVLKGERRLLLLKGERVLESYRIALGRNPLGHKVEEGDGRTPEGRYAIDWRNPKSRFYRSLHISYPNGIDKTRAQERGVSPGGNIMIHGLPRRANGLESGHAKWDWTEGCIAVTNAEIDRIWRLVDNGTAIEIRP